MKNINKYIPFFGILLFTSCLDLQPISEIGEGNFYKNTEEVNVGVIACYNGLQSTLENEWMMTDLRTDVSRLKNRSSSTAINKDIMALDESIVYAGHVEVQKYWTRVYHNIARCNTILRPETLGVVDNGTLRNQFQGEALLLRSYHYFNLVRLFGPIFLVTERITAKEARNYDRSSIEAVYTQIVNDLKYIVDNNLLPNDYPNEAGRVTSWTAKTLLAKVYLTRGELSSAKTLLEDIKDHSGHDILPNYADVFSTENEMNKEIIFAVRYKSGNVGLGNPFGNAFAALNSGSVIINSDGMGQNYPTTTLMNAYNTNPTDTRKSVTISEGYDDPIKGHVDEFYVTKYLAPVTLKNDGEKDVPILRFSDVLLMLAEIENEQGNIPGALSYLKLVRDRAKVPEIKETDVANTYELRLIIENERMMEFAYENQRFFDLVRTNRYIEVMNRHYETELFQFETKRYYVDAIIGQVTKPIEEWQLLLPIPTSEIDINPNITQNFGY